MERTLIQDLHTQVGKQVFVEGSVDVRRDHGKLVFIVLRDRTGFVQAVVHASNAEAFEAMQAVRAQSPVAITGTVQERPEKMRTDEQNGTLELSIESLTVLAKAHELPFDIDTDLNLDTLLDYRPLTLRTQRGRDIFSVQATIVQAYRNALIQRGFMEFQAPALVGGDAEGGAAAFKVDYFEDKAFLATSPQFYKEIMTGVFERAFTIAKIFRAEKSATTRHLSEITQMDFEMAFIKDFRDVTKTLEAVIRDVVHAVAEKHADVFARFNTTIPLLPQGEFPYLRLNEAQEIIEREFGGKALGEPDLEPEHERQICEWAAKEKGSDFVFITHFPLFKRAFYTHPDHDEPTNKNISSGFDLLFRGLEINSGSQRYHDYDAMIATMKERGLNAELFSFYLQMHKYGVAPHGGCSTGLERITGRMLELANVKEASAFPRDMTRIDKRLAE